MNLVCIIGNVATTPEIVTLPSGAQACTFDVTVSRTDGDPDIFTVVSTGRQAEVCNAYLDLGRRVGIEGTLRNVNGKVRIESTRVQLLSGNQVIA